MPINNKRVKSQKLDWLLWQFSTVLHSSTSFCTIIPQISVTKCKFVLSDCSFTCKSYRWTYGFRNNKTVGIIRYMTFTKDKVNVIVETVEQENYKALVFNEISISSSDNWISTINFKRSGNTLYWNL